MKITHITLTLLLFLGHAATLFSMDKTINYQKIACEIIKNSNNDTKLVKSYCKSRLLNINKMTNNKTKKEEYRLESAFFNNLFNCNHCSITWKTLPNIRKNFPAYAWYIAQHVDEIDKPSLDTLRMVVKKLATTILEQVNTKKSDPKDSE